ncbi:hypothetical protein TNCV_169701 [Trichonephila clavipes]|nr:hypothetical protein TNCV_169701 [Trichonephila clavipes]
MPYIVCGNGENRPLMQQAVNDVVFSSLHKVCDESVRNLSTNLLRRLLGDYKSTYISNQLQKVNGICKVDRVFKSSVPSHDYPMGVKYMTGWVSTSETVVSNLKSETQTGAKILWI